jgi:16S rRNA processing protein RimM
MVVLGRLGGPFGIKGWIKVESYTDPPATLLNYPVWQLATRDGGWESVTVVAGRPHGGAKGLVVELRGLTNPEDARQFGARDVALPRSAMPEPAPGEFYWEDLVDCEVVTLEGVRLGVVSHFHDFPANPVMAVRADGKEHWVPLVPRHLAKVDLARRHITVDWVAEF